MDKTETARKATTITLPMALLASAREIGLNISALTERALAAEIAEHRAKQWAAHHADAISEFNTRISEKGPALGRYRTW